VKRLCIKKFVNDTQASDVDRVLQSSIKREIRVLASFKHPNIIRLVGYCNEGIGKLCLVCELGVNGDLRKALTNPDMAARLDWRTRVRITLGIVSALNYLHCHIPGSPVFHRDVKSANIVIMGDLTPKIVDCGLATRFDNIQTNSLIAALSDYSTMASTVRVGTPGYICPIYASRGVAYSAISEIYSVGIVLLEIITGKCQGQVKTGSVQSFFQDFLDDIDIMCADSRAGVWNDSCFQKMLFVARRCTSLIPMNRFSAMVEVLRQLRELEQTHCHHELEAELDRLRRLYEEQLRASEREARVREEAELMNRRECGICFDASNLNNGVECRSAGKHFLCNGCFSDQTISQSGPDSRGNFVKNQNKIVCAFCYGPYLESEIASRCPQEAYVVFRRACDEVLILSEQQRHQEDIARLRDELSRMNGRDASVHRHRLYIAENLLTLHCPRETCRAAVLDFDGCFAVTCSACNCGFCGWCLADCGRDAHAHVKQCPSSRHQGSHYGSQEEFNQVHKDRKREEVTAYLNTIVDVEER
jgi:serine/threonine protein kinase